MNVALSQQRHTFFLHTCGSYMCRYVYLSQAWDGTCVYLLNFPFLKKKKKKIVFIYYKRHRERGRHRQREKQALQGARRGTRSQKPGIMPWAKGRH